MTGRLMAATALATLGFAGVASGDGVPVDTTYGPGDVTAPGADARLVTVPAGRSTVLARLRRDGSEVLRSTVLRGKLELPTVADQGTPSGLSADGGTVVLMRPRASFPRKRTVMAILDARNLRVRRLVTLPGDLSFDAISPDGTSLYLIQYLSASDQTRYAVRAYDVGAGRLRPRPVVDPHERADAMRGYPLWRAYSPGERWAYTLYDGNGKRPFVHALDTVGRTAVCVDIPKLADGVYDAHLAVSPGGRTLSVIGLHGPVAIVDTRTFRVTQPAPRPRGVARSSGGDGGGVGSWPLLGFAGLLLAGGALAARRRRRVATG